MSTINNTDLADRAKLQRDAAMEKESATLRNWLSGIISQKGATAESGNNLVSINKPREVTIDVSLPIASEAEPKKAGPISSRKALPESSSGGRIPTGCPYDLKLGVNEDTESWVSVHKHTGCSPTGVGNGVFERYATIFSNVSESGLWAYFGRYADFNLKSIVKSDQASYRLYNIDSSSYFGSLVKSSESSLWGYSSEQFNYKIKSDGSKSDIVLWVETGNGYTSSMWATASQAGLKLEDNLGNSSFLDTGNIWLKFDGGNDYTHGYPGYLRLQYTSGAYSNLYGGGLYINDSENWVQINPPDKKNAYFQKVLLGDLSQRWVLCSEASSGTMTCDTLSNSIVKFVRAKRIESHIAPLNLCGATHTYLDLVDSFLQVSANTATAKVTIEPNKIWVSDPDQSLSIEPWAVNIVSGAGASEFSDTFLHVSRDTGAYGSFDGAGWLELKNSQNHKAYLDGYRLTLFSLDSSASSELWAGALKIYGANSGNSILLETVDNSAEINISSSLGKIYIRTNELLGAKTLAKFRRVTDGNLKERYFLCTEPENSTEEGELTCETLPNPIVKNIRAKRIESHITPLNLCGATETYLDLVDSFLQVSANTATAKVTIEPSTIWVATPAATAKLSASSGSGTLELINSLNGTGTYQATQAKLEDSLGDSTLTTQSLHINGASGSYATFNGLGWLELKNAAGREIYLDPDEIVFTDGSKTSTHNANGVTSTNGNAYATVDGSGWLELKNAAGKEIYLDPEEIVFTDGAMTSTHNAEGFTATEGTDSGNLNSQELWMTLGGVGTTKVLGGSVQINKSNGGICTIEPPANTTAYFQKVNYVDSEFGVKEITVLTTTPIASGVLNPCTGVVACVHASEEFPTWSDANETYVDWNTLEGYPTWSEANQTYVDWATFSAVEAFVLSRINNALLGLGVDASCDGDGNVTVNLTGLPSTSMNSNFPTGPGVSA